MCMAEQQQPRSDAQSDSDDECDEPAAGTAFSDYAALDDAAPFLLEDVPPLPPPAGAVLSAAAEAPPAVKIEQGNGAVPVGAVAAHDTTAIKPDPGAGVDASPPPVAVGPVGWCSAGTAGPQRVAWLSTSTNRARSSGKDD